MVGGGRKVDLSFITATSDKILTGYIGCDQEGNQVHGTMTNQGAKTITLQSGTAYQIPRGYHNGLGRVSASGLSGETSGTATAADIIEGKTAWVGGVKLIGTMPNRSAVGVTLNAGNNYYIPEGYHDGYGIVSANNLSNQTLGTATAADIITGKTAWVNGTKITGVLREQYTREFLLNLEDYGAIGGVGSASGTVYGVNYNNPNAKSYMININCEELGGTGFFHLPNSSGNIQKQFTIENEIRVTISVSINSSKTMDITIEAVNIGAEYLYYDFYADIIYSY